MAQSNRCKEGSLVHIFSWIAISSHLCESPVRETCTLGLSGGRRLASRGASSDPTGSSTEPKA